LYRYFVSQSSEFCHHNTLYCFSTSVYCCKHILVFRYNSVRKLLDTLTYYLSIYVCFFRVVFSLQVFVPKSFMLSNVFHACYMFDRITGVLALNDTVSVP